MAWDSNSWANSYASVGVGLDLGQRKIKVQTELGEA